MIAIRRITVDDNFDWLQRCKKIIKTPTMQLFPLWLAHEMFTSWNDTLVGAVIEGMGGYTVAMVFQIVIVLLYLAPQHVDVDVQKGEISE